VLRPAQTGDYFLVARPTGDDERMLHEIQNEIAAELGGEPEPYIHVTLQRFELPETLDEDAFLAALEATVKRCTAAEVIATSLFCTFHRYFQRHSLRWKVDATPALGRLTLQSAQFIMHQGGTSHWPNAEAPIAQFMTAVWVPKEITVPDPLQRFYPQRLMNAARVEVTKLIGNQQFEILREFRLAG